jgi:ATP-dependent RNA helicase SUPV3L1/SUV3
MAVRNNVTALLGPTNTGKTHHAVERMLGHPSGMIGLPLRLLAREVYDRIAARAGTMSVALVTGEEKIIPADPRYWVCTVEAMPLDIPVSFLAVDEIQLAADTERGHVFTDRLLHARGINETMLLGADTIRPLLEQLLKQVRFVSRPRFSKLAYTGSKKITRLPKRTAIVAFSADMVYSVAELIRRQRGGAAVVLGALSPRTRNAQVELYQSGDVDHIVATDAIGMGLNMDIDHVVFAATRKFDGRHFRNLTPAELGQIAGRAGRYLQDGTFGVTADAAALDAETIERLEDHRFEALKVLQWRNRNLNFSSLDRLLGSLNALPNKAGLARAQAGADIDTLALLAQDRTIADIACDKEMIELLWQTCQLPDYRNITGAEHANLVASIFRFIARTGRIDAQWFARQLGYCDNTDGDIDTLSNRIAHVRTWTFVANRPDWLADTVYWQERTRSLEDKLSDALHERLSQRFIDRRTSVLIKRLRERNKLMSHVDQDGTVLVENQPAGCIEGLCFKATAAPREDARMLESAANQTIAKSILDRAQSLVAAPDPDLSIDQAGRIIWMSHPVGRLAGSTNPLKPQVEVIADEYLQPADRDAVQMRLGKFVSRHIAAQLEPLVSLQNAEDITGIARGIAFQLVEAFGVLPREQVADQVKELAQEERALLRRHGVRFGAFHIFIPAMLKPAPSELRLLLWAVHDAENRKLDPASLPAYIPQQGLTSVHFNRDTPRGFYQIVGFRLCGDRAVRVDMLERLADMIRSRVFWKPDRPADTRPEGSVEGGGFVVIPDMMSLVGCSGDEFSAILRTLGFSMQRRKAAENLVGAKQAQPESGDSAAGGEEPLEIRKGASGPGQETGYRPDDGVEPSAEPGSDKPDEGVNEAGPAGTGEGTQPDETGTADPEMIEVWWPKDTGPFRHRKPADSKHRREKSKPGYKKGRSHPGGRDAPAAGNRKASAHKSSKPRQRREADPDSPFAVLSKLKQDLGGG